MRNIHFWDYAVIAGYFAILLVISVWAARREKIISSDYFLAGRDVGWLAVGASLFASNIGSEHLVGLAGTGAASVRLPPRRSQPTSLIYWWRAGDSNSHAPCGAVDFKSTSVAGW